MTSVVRPRGDAHERLLERQLGPRVERRGRLVQHQDRRVLEHHARDGDPLLLAARELQAALAHDRPVALGQADDEVVDLRHAGRGLDLGLAGTRPAVGDVGGDRVVEQHRVLRHDADRAAQAVPG